MQWAVEKSGNFHTPVQHMQNDAVVRKPNWPWYKDSMSCTCGTTRQPMTVIIGATSDRDWTLKSSLSGLLVARTSPCLLVGQYLPCCRNITEVTRGFCCRCVISDLTREENTPSHKDIFKQFWFCTKPYRLLIRMVEGWLLLRFSFTSINGVRLQVCYL